MSRVAIEGNIFPPKDKESGTWKPIPRLGSVIPFGYELDPEDNKMLLPIPSELELLEQAKKHLKKYSSRSVAAWLSENSGRSITHTGLLQRVKVERKRKRQTVSYATLAKRYEALVRKAEELKNSRLGASATEASGD